LSAGFSTGQMMLKEIVDLIKMNKGKGGNNEVETNDL